MNEIWKSIPGYENRYEVSNLGNIRSVNFRNSFKNKILLPYLQPTGYLAVQLCKDGHPKKFLVHRLVALAFLLNSDNLPAVNHKDENKQNNTVDNLEWTTYKENNNYGTRNRRIAETKSKPIYQCDKNGVILKEWSSSKEVEKILGLRRGHIIECANGKRLTAYGFTWKFKANSD